MYPLRDGSYQVYDLTQEHAHVPFQRDVLVGSIQSLPRAFLGWDDPFGREEPRWVVRVPLALDRFVSQTVHDLCLNEPAYLAFLASRWRTEAQSLRLATAHCRSLPVSAGPWAGLLLRMARSGAFAACNWLTPNREMVDRLVELTHLAPEAHQQLLQLMVPGTLPLALRVEAAQVEVLTRIRTLGKSDANAAIRRYELDWGCLVCEPFEDSPQNRAGSLQKHTAGLLQMTADEGETKRNQMRRLSHMHRSQVRSRQDMVNEIIDTLPSFGARLWARGAANFLSLIAEEEEERHILRSRALALIEARVVTAHLRCEDCDSRSLLEGGAVQRAASSAGM